MTFMRSISALSAMMAVATAPLGGQMPTTYHVGTTVALPDSLVEVFAGGRFQASIVRRVHTARERELIDIAERLYPGRKDILGAAYDEDERKTIAAAATGQLTEGYRNQPRAPGRPEDRWWLSHFDGTWTPYAVTGSAARYYLARLEDLAAGRGKFEYSPGEKPDRATFEYRARVRESTRRGTAHVVELRLTWDYWCGMLCAMSFTKIRTVYFDAKGGVVKIEGDSRAEVGAS